MRRAMHEALLSSETTPSQPTSVPARIGRFAKATRALVAGLIIASGFPAAMRAEEIERSEHNGALVIAGGGKLPQKIRDKFVELGGGKNAKVVIIPSAHADANSPEQQSSFVWPELQSQVDTVDIFHAKDRAEANDNERTRVLDRATAVWFSGGVQEKLTTAYQDTLALRKIFKVLNRGGVVGGTSAGAAVMSKPMIKGGSTEPEIGDGFNFLPETIVDQHFLKRERGNRLRRAINAHPDHVGLGIDEGTALVVRSGELCVMGESSVSILRNSGDTEVLTDGETRKFPLTVPALLKRD